MNWTKRITLSLFLCFLIGFFTSCDEKEIIGDTGPTPQEFTHLSISLTDAPAQLDEVNVEIVKVNILTDKKDGEIELSTFSNVYDLLKLQNGITTLLAETDLIGATRIYQIRLILGNNNYVVSCGERFPLLTTESLTDLLKVHCNIAIDHVLKKDILLDFDAEKSIINNPDGSFILHPHIRIMD